MDGYLRSTLSSSFSEKASTNTHLTKISANRMEIELAVSQGSDGVILKVWTSITSNKI